MTESNEQAKKRVLEGEDGWLYLDNDKNDSVGQYIGQVEIKPSVLNGWLRMLTEMQSLAGQHAFAHVHVIAPSKESVYGSWYPHRGLRAPILPSEVLLNAAGSNYSIIYPVNELRQAPGLRVYDKGDTHWNDYGAFIAARIALASVGKADALNIDDFEFSEIPRTGDLDSKMEPRRHELRIAAQLRNSKPTLLFDSEVNNRGRTMVYSNPSARLGSLVLFGDSFGWYLATMFGQAFRRLVFVHTTSPDASIIEHEKPDIVVTECTERFLIERPSPPSTFRITNVVKAKFSSFPDEERQRLLAFYQDKAATSTEPYYSQIFLNALA